MNQSTINRYQPGGDIYATLVAKYGTIAANSIAAAAATGNRNKLGEAIALARGDGEKRNDSVLSNFGNQLVTDPLAAPLEKANEVAANSFLSLLKAPAVLLALVIIGFSLMGGWQWLGKKMFNK